MMNFLPHVLLALATCGLLVKYVKAMNRSFKPWVIVLTFSIPLAISGFYSASILKVYNESQQVVWGKSAWAEFMTCNHILLMIFTIISTLTSIICVIGCFAEGVRHEDNAD